MAAGGSQSFDTHSNQVLSLSVDDFVPGHPTLDSFSKKLLESLVDSTRRSNALPEAGDDYQFYDSFPQFRRLMEGVGARLLNGMQQLLRQERPEDVPNFSTALGADDDEARFDKIVDAVDSVLEKVDVMLDEVSGVSKNARPVLPAGAQQSPALIARLTPKGSRLDYSLVHAKNIKRPQLRFEDKIDNSNVPFVPHPLAKTHDYGVPPHSRGPSPDRDVVPPHIQSHIRGLGISSDDGGIVPGGYPHPFQLELEGWKPTAEQLEVGEERVPLSLEQVPCTWVDTPALLDSLARKLEMVGEFAVDLEQHSYRSFQGIVCLMQISTRDEDFLVDTLELRSHLQGALHKAFTNPRIVKVLHGADSDIVWLQRDFGLYLVNLFDTGQAARVLDFPSFGLAHLLKSYCNVNADKKYQLADWRMRPIPAEMLRYAREDTHYLLYIYDKLRTELIMRGGANKNLLMSSLNRSRDICLKRYEKELLTETSHLHLYARYSRPLSSQQLAVLKAVYAWRDRVSRDEDESTRYVLPNHMMFAIAEAMPSEQSGIIACCNPTPPLVRVGAADLVVAIQKAKESVPIDALPPPPPQQVAQQVGVDLSGPYGAAQLITTAPPSVPGQSANTLGPQPTSGAQSHAAIVTAQQLFQFAGWVANPPTDAAAGVTIVAASGDSGVVAMDTDAGALEEFAEEDGIVSNGLFQVGASIPAGQIGSGSAAGAESRAVARGIHGSFESPLAHVHPRTVSAAGPSTNTSSATSAAVSSTAVVAAGAPGAESAFGGEGDGAVPAKPPTPMGQREPRSYSEIYQLSNMNRKRNKEKKRLKEDSFAMPLSPLTLENGGSGGMTRSSANNSTNSLNAIGLPTTGTHSRERSGSDPSMLEAGDDHGPAGVPKPAEGEDVNAFMRRIGWNASGAAPHAGGQSRHDGTAGGALAGSAAVANAANAAIAGALSGGMKTAAGGIRGGNGSSSAPGSKPIGKRIPDGTQFVPYDYNAVNAQGGGIDSRPLNAQAPVFNPYSETIEPKRTGRVRSNVRPKSGQRSVTYGAGSGVGGGAGGSMGPQGGAGIGGPGGIRKPKEGGNVSHQKWMAQQQQKR